MDDGQRRLLKQGVAWALTVIAALLIWWATSDDEGGSAPTGRLGTSQTKAAESDSPTTPASTTSSAPPESSVDPVSGLLWVAAADLPAEARDTLDEIAAGPPYPYDRDGITFENREGLLPAEEDGYYQEFTVETPGSSDRGARRIIWGLEDEFYYTDDHYESFRRISP